MRLFIDQFFDETMVVGIVEERVRQDGGEEKGQIGEGRDGKIDQDGNGEIDHQEATNAFNFAIDLENTIHMVFCACGHDENFDLTLEEYLSPVCEVLIHL